MQLPRYEPHPESPAGRARSGGVTGRKPDWLKIRIKTGPEFNRVRRAARELELNTICEEGHCPNIYECWSLGTATFMILGDVCTRRCGFCNVKTGMPSAPPDPAEPARLAEGIARLGIQHAVITSVDRDDLPDGGAAHFAAVIAAIRDAAPDCAVEVLTPDFKQDRSAALDTVLAERPAIFSHNVETVPELYRTVRPGSRFDSSLSLLRAASERRGEFGGHTKTSMMLGLGETDEQILGTLHRLREAGVDVVTMGQYLRPTPDHLSVRRYVTPEEFASWKERGEALGFRHVEAGPLVRSSYHAHTHVPG